MSTCSQTRQTLFPVYTKESALEKSQPALDHLKKSVGSIPNLAGAMAGSPALISAFVNVRGLIQKNSSFSDLERELLFLANATANTCGYCQAIHSTFAKMNGLDQTTIEAVRARKPLFDARQNALVSLTRSVAENRGRVSDEEIDAFLKAGYKPEHILEIIACFAQSVMANYTNHIAHVKPDEFIQEQYNTITQ